MNYQLYFNRQIRRLTFWVGSFVFLFLISCQPQQYQFSNNEQILIKTLQNYAENSPFEKRLEKLIQQPPKAPRKFTSLNKEYYQYVVRKGDNIDQIYFDMCRVSGHPTQYPIFLMAITLNNQQVVDKDDQLLVDISQIKRGDVIKIEKEKLEWIQVEVYEEPKKDSLKKKKKKKKN